MNKHHELKGIIILGACAMLQACTGSSGDPVIRTVVADTSTVPLPNNSQGLAISKPATTMDGYEGGLRVTRDTTGLAGGLRGSVNATSLTHTIVGRDVTAFEWTSLSILDNYATAGENVASYAQANKYGTGPTWAAVSECVDTTGLLGACVSHEFDLMISGTDNGSRIGLDIIVGDALVSRGLGQSVQADATTAIRIGTMLAHPWASWGTGIEIGPVRDSSVKVKDASGHVVFEVKPNGDIYRRGVLLP